MGAQELFGTFDQPTELAQSIIAVRSSKSFSAAVPTGDAGGVAKGKGMKITETEKKRFEALVRKARTLAEVQKLEKMFAEGKLPLKSWATAMRWMRLEVEHAVIISSTLAMLGTTSNPLLQGSSRFVASDRYRSQCSIKGPSMMK